MIQNEFRRTLHYELVSEQGPDHNKLFTVQAYMDQSPLMTEPGVQKRQQSRMRRTSRC